LALPLGHLTKLCSSISPFSFNRSLYPSLSIDIYTDIMDKNALFRFLLVLLTLSCVVFVAAVPAISKFQGFDAELLMVLLMYFLFYF